MITRANIEGALAALAERRPVFHSEADFQHELAWEIRKRHDIGVRLERPVEPAEPIEPSEQKGTRGSVDIWIKDGPQVIETKYWTKRLEWLGEGEFFKLIDQGRQPLNRYDFWKDVARIERLLSEDSGDHIESGFIVALTNVRSYWKQGKGRTIDERFQFHEGSQVSGTLTWSSEPKPSPGTIKGRKRPIEIRGRYHPVWHDYPASKETGTEFRYLLVDVAAGRA